MSSPLAVNRKCSQDVATDDTRTFTDKDRQGASYSEL